MSNRERNELLVYYSCLKRFSRFSWKITNIHTITCKKPCHRFHERKRHGGKDGVRSAEYGVRSAECGVRSTECAVRSAEYRVRSAECGVRSAECGVRSAECGVRSAEYGVRSAESVSVKVFL